MRNFISIYMMAIFFIGFTSSYAQSHYDKGWEYFNENKLDEARDEFIDASKNSSTAREAFLSLALLNTVDKEGLESF